MSTPHSKEKSYHTPSFLPPSQARLVGVAYRDGSHASRFRPAAFPICVEQIWYYQDDPQPHSKERLLPDGCMSLGINLAENQIRLYDPDDNFRLSTFGPVTFTGPRTSSIAIDTETQLS
jgi:hypothetical protein